MNQKWSDVAFLRWEIQKGYCPICGKKILLSEKSKERRMVAHHVQNRSKGGESTLKNCEVRHADCEAWAHKTTRDGNPKPAQIKRYRQFGE